LRSRPGGGTTGIETCRACSGSHNKKKKVNTALTWVELKGNAIGDKGAAALAEAW